MMEYLPYTKLDGIPCIIVDGRPHKDATTVLSHWKNSGTKPEWIRDTSTEIVFDYLDHHSIPDNIKYVSNDHYDQDGLVAMFALTHPDIAQKHRRLLIDVAEAGDFGKCQDRQAAKIAMVLNNFVIPASGYFVESIFSLPYVEQVAEFYHKGLSLLPAMLENIDAFKELWEEEDEFLSYSETLVNADKVSIEEDMDNDLAIVTIPTELEDKKFYKFATNHFGAIHEMAIHNATQRARIFFIHGKQIQFKYRYETWVQLKNNVHPLRVNLAPLAEKLNQIDRVRWVYDGSSAIVPSLHTEENEETSLRAEIVFELLTQELKSGEVDWDPYRT